MYTAAAKGIWARHGLDVDIVDPEPGPENVKAVAAGRNDACLTSVAHFLRAVAEQPDVEARFGFMVARRTHLSAFVHADSGIERFENLAGRTLLGPAESAFTREYRALEAQLGLEPAPLLELTYAKVIRGFRERRGDVAVDFLNLLPRFGDNVRPLPFYEAGVDVYGSGLVVGTRLLAERPELVCRLTDALREALLETLDDPEPGFAAMQQRFSGLRSGRVLADWRAGAPLIFFDADIGAMDDAGWRRTLAHHATVHGAPQPAPESVYAERAASTPAAA